MKYFFVIIAVLGFGCAQAQLSHQQQETILKNLNQVRKKGCHCDGTYYAPTRPLSLNSSLSKVAQTYAEEISERRHLSHTGKNGSKAGDRIKKGGYQWSYYGENIAGGYRTVVEVMKAWLESPSHCRTLMNPNYIDVGIGFHDSFWVTNFGAPKPKS